MGQGAKKIAVEQPSEAVPNSALSIAVGKSIFFGQK